MCYSRIECWHDENAVREPTMGFELDSLRKSGASVIPGGMSEYGRFSNKHYLPAIMGFSDTMEASPDVLSGLGLSHRGHCNPINAVYAVQPLQHHLMLQPSAARLITEKRAVAARPPTNTRQVNHFYG